jgi:hypothetical protein
MTPILQNILALTLVSVCGGWSLWQGVKSVRGKRSRLGSCCSKGCGAGTPQAKVEKTHFLPSEMLRRR